MQICADYKISACIVKFFVGVLLRGLCRRCRLPIANFASVTCFLNSPRSLSLSLLIKKTAPLATKTTFWGCFCCKSPLREFKPLLGAENKKNARRRFFVLVGAERLAFVSLRPPLRSSLCDRRSPARLSLVVKLPPREFKPLSRHKKKSGKPLFVMVGAERFELPTLSV